MPVDAKTLPKLQSPPDIEEALRNPANEGGYRADYFRVLAARAMPVISNLVKDNPDQEAQLRSILEGHEGSAIVNGQVTKALAESGLLRLRGVVCYRPEDMEGKDGWFEWKTIKGGERDDGEYTGIVEQYFVELPASEAQAPVSREIRLEVKQEQLAGQRNRYGGPMWGDYNYDRWTLSCR